MKQCQVIQELESAQLRSDLPKINVGDTINIHQRIIEGEKERLQMFSGTVIARRGGGLSETITLYRFSYGSGVERVFMIHSPKIAKIEVIKKGDVRKSKLYYLRGTSGKASKVKEHIGPLKEKAKKAVQTEAEPAT